MTEKPKKVSVVVDLPHGNYARYDNARAWVNYCGALLVEDRAGGRIIRGFASGQWLGFEERAE